jgi:hypothetical protein
MLFKYDEFVFNFSKGFMKHARTGTERRFKIKDRGILILGDKGWSYDFFEKEVSLKIKQAYEHWRIERIIGL